jgi:23S rRNA (uridine2552-2'-O)-methyltransferase
MAYIPNDKWAVRAKQEGYLARSAYKLKSINQKFKILKNKDLVLDLGSAPGSWMQVVEEIIGAEGFVIGVDIDEIKPKILKLGNVVFLKKDIYDEDLTLVLKKAANGRKFNVVVSDAAPKTTGQKDVDEWRSHELCLRVIDVMKSTLKIGGNAAMKVFEGPDTPEIMKIIKAIFRNVNLIKPEASIKGSKESYIVAKGFKPVVF